MWLRRLIGVMLVFGGGYGLFDVVQSLRRPLSDISVFIHVLFFLMYTWSIVAGIFVFENQGKGWLWAKILLLIQIPVIKTSVISYQFMVGAGLNADFAAAQVRFRLATGAEYDLDFFVTHALSLGVNIIALVLFLFIWKRE